MAHGISEQQWLRYADGELDWTERRQVEDHLAVCAACAAEAAELRNWHEVLRVEGARLGEALRAGDADMERLTERTLARLRGGHAGAWTVRDALSLLRVVMEPICGSGATRAAMNLAIRRSAGAEEALTGTNWALFVGNLREATTAVCGLATGRLVSRAAFCLPIGSGPA